MTGYGKSGKKHSGKGKKAYAPGEGKKMAEALRKRSR